MATATANKRTDWAEDGEEDETPSLPPNEVIKNSNGTETHISYRVREDGKKVKTTRIIRRTVIKATVNPRVAERRAWAKFGDSARDGAGPQSQTTTVGEDIQLNPRQGFKSGEAAEKEQVGAAELAKQQLNKSATVKCRLCNGDHFTARCPFKGSLAPEGDPGSGLEPAIDPTAPEGTTKKGAYVPPGARGGGGAGEKMPGSGKYERDDLATLRVTNVSEYAEEDELRDLFSRWGRVTRVFLAKDRETNRAKGFAFVSYADRDDAQRACEKVDGFGYNNLILRVEFAKKTTS